MEFLKLPIISNKYTYQLMTASVSCTEQSVALSNIIAKYQRFTTCSAISFFETIRDAANKLCALDATGIRIGHFDAVLFLQCQKWPKCCEWQCHLLHNCVSCVKINDEIVLGAFRFFGLLRIKRPQQWPCMILADITTLAMLAATAMLCMGFSFEIATPSQSLFCWKYVAFQRKKYMSLASSGYHISTNRSRITSLPRMF